MPFAPSLALRRRSLWTLPSVAALLLALSVAGAAGCGGERPARTPPTAAGLPSYDSAAAALLDDGFAPRIFGLSSGGTDSSEIARRAEAAQAVVAARLVTVTRDTTDDSLAYQLVLNPVGTPLMGNWEGSSINIQVNQENPAFPMLDAEGVALAGHRVILFLRMYDQGGHATLHFHAEADTPATRKAVQDARAFNAFGS